MKAVKTLSMALMMFLALNGMAQADTTQTEAEKLQPEYSKKPAERRYMMGAAAFTAILVAIFIKRRRDRLKKERG